MNEIRSKNPSSLKSLAESVIERMSRVSIAEVSTPIPIDELIQVIQTLGEREDLYHQLIDNLQEVLWIGSSDWQRIWYVNRAYEHLWDRPLQSLYDKPMSWLDSVIAEDRERVLVEVREKVASNVSRHDFMEYRIARRDGSIRWVMARAFPITDNQGRVYRIAGLAVDVTPMKQADQDLRASESRFRALVDHAPVGILLMDEQGKCQVVNQRWCEMAGLSLKEAAGYGWMRTLLRSERRTFFRKWREAARTGREFRFDLQFRTTDKESWQATSIVALSDETGKTTGYLGTFTDITLRRIAEERAKQSEIHYRTLAENLTGIVYRVYLREANRMRFFNSALESLTGFQPEELGTGTICSIEPLILEKDREWVVHTVRNAVLTHKPFEVAYRLRRKNGEIGHFFERGKPIYDENGAPIYIDGVIFDVTEQKQREEALRQSESRFRSLFESSPDAVFLTVSDGSVEAANSSASAIFDWTEQELRKLGLSGVLDTEDPRLSAAIVNRKKTGRNQRQELTAIRRNGEKFPVEIDSVIFPEEPGSSFVILRDISPRKKAEQELRESEGRLSLALDSGQMGLWEWDVRTNQSVWNAKEYELLGIPPGNGREPTDRFFQRVHPEDLPAFKQVLERTIEKGTDWRDECRIIRPDGQLRWLVAIGRVVRDENGHAVRMIGVNYDITERKRAEERAQLLSDVTAQLLASNQPQQVLESLCRKIMAHLDCHVFFNYLVDGKKGRLHLNAYAGIAAEAAREIEWLDYGMAVCGCAARDGCRIVAEKIPITPDPRTELVKSYGVQSYAAHPLLNQGQVIGTLSFGSRTKAFFSEEELGLMKTVADHVAIAIQRVRLMQSLSEQVRVAEAANQAKSRFLAGMSHELRTPMNAILGMVDVALPKTTDPTARDCLQTAKGSADLLLTLLNDLLDSARIESGRLELESLPFSLRSMLVQVTKALSLRASEKGLKFRCRIADETPDAVVGDRVRLQQVLLNLAGNAIKFTEAGEVEIWLNAIPGDGEVTLEFSVRDTGIGISPSGLKDIFLPFTQADASTTRRFGGTGLGLSISKSLVEMMGGTIWIESEVGKGSNLQFKILLPLAGEIHPDSETPPAIGAEAGRQLRILLAEDNSANQKLAAYILQDRGHIIDLASDGREAIRMAEQNRYDVILMDVQMPGIDGFEATTEIRKREGPSGGRTPIIAMTAYAMKGDRERCLAAGMDGYLSKPISRQEMVSLVESLSAGSMPSSSIKTADCSRLETPRTVETLVFNSEEALKRCYNSKEMLQEMIHCYFVERKDCFAQMRTALETGVVENVGRLCHRMKGMVVYFGAEPAKDAAERLERICETGSSAPTEAAKAIDEFERECDALGEQLFEYQTRSSD